MPSDGGGGGRLDAFRGRDCKAYKGSVQRPHANGMDNALPGHERGAFPRNLAGTFGAPFPCRTPPFFGWSRFGSFARNQNAGEKTMKRIRLMTMAGAIVVFLAATSNAAAPDAPPSESTSGTASVESAGPDGNLPARMAEVSSADYAARPHHGDGLPAVPLAVAAVVGAGLLAAALVVRMRQKSQPPVA